VIAALSGKLSLLPTINALRTPFSFGNGSQAIETAGACFRCFFQMRLEIVGKSDGF
jgi:hypothetical protein